MAYKVSNNPSGTAHMISSISDKWEPQRTNNFELQIVGLNKSQYISNTTGESVSSNMSKAIMLSVASYSAPKINVGTIAVQYGNNTVKYAGKPEFPDSTIVLNDYIGLDIEKAISDWQKMVYDPDNEVIGRAKNYKKDAYLIEYSPDGSIYRTWKVEGCWPSQVDLGEFAQEGGSVRQITVTLVYDRVIPGQRGTSGLSNGFNTGV